MLGSQSSFLKSLDRLHRPHRIAVQVIWNAEIEQIARHHDCGVSHNRAERRYVTRMLAVVILDRSFERPISFYQRSSAKS
jgi:hypothetical protein